MGVVTRIDVEGVHYVPSERVLAIAGLAPGQDLFSLELDRARQALLLPPRVAGAVVEHRWLRGLRVRIQERLPVLLVQHGVPWELDSAGVLLAPLQPGVVADVPLLTGPRFDALPAGAQIRSEPVARGLAWAQALAERELQLSGRVSEVDVSDPSSTGLTLLGGTRVLAPAWPPGTRRLSALRVVLADLERRGTVAEQVDLRFENQVIVQPLEGPKIPRDGPRKG
ncbi:MAG: hypothetical protein A2V63_11445 [Candidatus Eisenbacteria bacterium RBG_19FT_COMBO_70_11]|nr:MAG: hypothetical protein A2V63_11445 [Candidatus Eisenbacteria bacterium RBG_19FT_COMBO_70_11]